MIQLTKEQILNSGDWLEADYINDMEGYHWKHKSILNDNYTFYMRRFKSDGSTIIIEEGRDDNKLFDGYIENIEDLNQVVRLLKLNEI